MDKEDMMKKETAIAAGLATAAVVGLAAVALAKPPPSPVLVEEYLKKIAAAITLEELERVRTAFEADYSANRLTRADYETLYDAYVKRSGEISKATALDITAIKPDKLMRDPEVYVDGSFVGKAPLLWRISAGQHTVKWEDKPGGDYPAPGVEYYKAPAPQTVTVTEGQTLKVEGVYIAALLSKGDAEFIFFSFDGYGPNPTLPSGSQIVTIGLRNPVQRSISYRVYVYNKMPEPVDPAPEDPIGGSIGYADTVLPPGSWTFKGEVRVPDQTGTFPIWLRIYDMTGGFYRFLKRVDTGTTYTMGAPPPPPPPPPPLGWPIETQLKSIMPYLVIAWVLRAGTWLFYDPEQLGVSALQEIYTGEEVWLRVNQPCNLTYGLRTWSLKPGDNQMVW